MTKKKLYYLTQLGGWGAFLVLGTWYAFWSDAPVTFDELLVNVLLVGAVGFITTHLYREVIIRRHWPSLPITRLIPRVLVGSLGCAVFAQLLVSGLVLLAGSFSLPNAEEIPGQLIIWGMVFFIWSLLYFAFHFFQNYRKEEIKNLRYEASNREFELNRLKSQLNPHFIFNSMNTIRALVDEDPQKAKRSITQLANVLRNSLHTGKQKVVTLEEELNLVQDYLGIEQARYEERLRVHWSIDPAARTARIPPLMLQTLVENGIKHGISKLPEGGEIHVSASREEDLLRLEITNDGHFNPDQGAAGFGLINTRQRLELLYGPAASFAIANRDHRVQTVLTFPTHPPQL